MWRFIQGGGWIAILAVVIAGWLVREIQGAEWRGRADERSASADSMHAAIIDSMESVWAGRDSTTTAAIDSLAGELDSQRGAVRVARHSASQAILAAQATISDLSDSVVTLTAVDAAAISAAFDSAEAAVETCDGALQTCQVLADTTRSRVWDLEARLAQTLAIGQEQARAIDALRSMRPPVMGKGGWIATIVAGAATVVAIVATVAN